MDRGSLRRRLARLEADAAKPTPEEVREAFRAHKETGVLPTDARLRDMVEQIAKAVLGYGGRYFRSRSADEASPAFMKAWIPDAVGRPKPETDDDDPN